MSVKKHILPSKGKIIINDNDNNNIILKNTDQTIEKIYHMADIHIRIETDRHVEYKEVFDNLYDEIRKDSDNAIIVICGDILHSRIILRPECVSLTKDFFTNLASITDLFLIPGNHDCNMSNSQAMDSLHSIIQNLNTKNKIYLLKENGNYEYENIIFGVTSLFSEKVTKPLDKIKNKIQIALYHGQVYGSSYFNDIKPNKEDVDFIMSDFKNYDLVLLGDIHKRQFIDKNKTIAYSSSLIQQNYGETIAGHGIIKWNLETLKGTPIDIKNDYGFITFEVKNNNNKKIDVVCDEIDLMPSKPRIRINYYDLTYDELKKIQDKITKKYNPIELIANKQIYDNNISINYNIDNKKIQLSEIKDAPSVIKIIADHIQKNKIDIQDDMIKKINDEIKISINKCDKLYSSNSIKDIKIKKLHFENIFAYGPNNLINFNKCKNIIGLVAPNHYGKSSIIDIIEYSIYGNTSRTKYKNDIINNKSKNYNTVIEFAIGTDNYIIERTGVKKNKINVTEKIILTKNDEVISSEMKNATNDNIRDIVGDENEFMFISTMLQKDYGFVDMSDNERVTLLRKLFKLDIFKNILDVSKNELGSMYNKIADVKNDIDELKKVLADKNDCDFVADNQKLSHKKTKLEREMMGILKENIKIKLKLVELEKKNELLTTQNVTVDEMERNIRRKSKLSKRSDELNDEINEIKDKLSSINLEDGEAIEINYKKIVDENSKKLKRNRKELDNLLTRLTKIDKSESQLVKERDKLNKNKANVCAQLKDNESEIKKLKNKIVVMDSDGYESYEDVEKESNNHSSLFDELSMVKQEYKTMKLKRTENSERQKGLEDFEYNIDCKQCMKNPNIIEKIKCNKLAEKIEDDINQLKKKIKKLEEQIKNKQIYVDKWNEWKKINSDNKEINREIDELTNKVKLLNKENEINEMKLNEVDVLIDKMDENKTIQLDIDKVRNNNKELENYRDEEYDNYIALKQEKDKLEKQLNDINSKLIDNTNELKKVTNDLNIYKDSQDDIMEYEKLKLLVENNELKNNELTNKVQEIGKEIDANNKEICSRQIYEKQLEDFESKLKVNQDKKDIHEKIKMLLDKGGLIDTLMDTHVIPQIQISINEILSLITDFTIDICRTNNIIKIYKKEGAKLININLVSGFERFIINLAFKITLAKQNTNLRTNYLIIDEGFSCCDEQNSANIKNIFEYVRKNYDFCLLISHLDNIKMICDNSINISKNDGFSQIYHK
ncbi:MAG: putative DNA repair protein [Edafosvirus sp.]|uniref:Putative DNA repair protein n=1 Tax=Edafosvirus sp. TaxID=2487765 RepID=A0A3G4ZWS6_9VIRU|nr:MAG: putative DNA repair protein [Edafosvirus sp.]